MLSVVIQTFKKVGYVPLYTFRKSLFDIQRLKSPCIAHQPDGIHTVQIHLIGIRDLPDHRSVRSKEVKFIRIYSLGPTFSAR